VLPWLGWWLQPVAPKFDFNAVVDHASRIPCTLPKTVWILMASSGLISGKTLKFRGKARITIYRFTKRNRCLWFAVVESNIIDSSKTITVSNEFAYLSQWILINTSAFQEFANSISQLYQTINVKLQGKISCHYSARRSICRSFPKNLRGSNNANINGRINRIRTLNVTQRFRSLITKTFHFIKST
jgi:hypothetical protein